MSRTTENIIRIVQAGGNMNVNGERMTTENMIRIAMAAVKSGSTITFMGLGKHTTENLIRIVKAGGKNVIVQD
ncbi:hypothetical protein [Aeromonas sp. FDAARGOS 1416]|uniref:hypothetical protein n=1 Tax=Aeromonas TaxID=642 RepID=UPI001C23B1BB|nr:hypothetical protein [Aeromonas sp. FDAARGOS 1416]QXB02779.1 hypothetical protein I6L46_05300 [Aeromonas sp. FDAARGOS 1416]